MGKRNNGLATHTEREERERNIPRNITKSIDDYGFLWLCVCPALGRYSLILALIESLGRLWD